jgi:hypothetical protein
LLLQVSSGSSCQYDCYDDATPGINAEGVLSGDCLERRQIWVPPVYQMYIV